MESNKLLEKASKAIPTVLEDSKLTEDYKLYHVKVNWKSIMGDKIAQYSYIKKIDHGIMTVAVTNPVWMNHLFMYKEKIIQAINEYCKEDLIKDVQYVKSGRLPKKNLYEDVEGKEESIVPKLNTKGIVLPKEIVDKIREETKKLPEALGEKIRQLRYSHERLKIAYLEQGYIPCPSCGRWIEKKEGKCIFCLMKEKSEEKQKIYQFLMQAPWLSFQELQEEIPCKKNLYNEVRRDCIYRLIEKVYNNNDSDEDDLFLVLFITRRKPADLTEDYIQNIVKKYRRKDDVSSYRRQSND